MEVQSGRAPGEHEITRTSLQEKPGNSINKPLVSGSCACGLTKWESAHLPTRGSFCYCRTCRKLSGGAFIAFMDLPSVTFFPTICSPSSTLKLMALSKNAERGFCSACGSTLTMRYLATPETLYLTIASVDADAEENAVSPLKGLSWKHIYVKEKVDWYSLPDDGLPRFETMPNEVKYLIS